MIFIDSTCIRKLKLVLIVSPSSWYFTILPEGILLAEIQELDERGML